MKTTFVTYEQLKRDVVDWVKDLPCDWIDVIVGVERSGLIPATMLALHLNKPVITLSDYLRGYFGGEVGYIDSKIKVGSLCNALIVDDSINSGRAIKNIKEAIGNDLNYKTAVVYARNETADLVDYYYKIVNIPRMFEWNFMHHENLRDAIMDIDGVIFEEPPCEDNTEEYIKYISNPTPLYIPTQPIAELMTGRLEKYRDITEKTLREYNIKYERLVMCQFSTPQERRMYDIGKIKGEYFKKSEFSLFIESSKKQADKIREVSNKQVICIEELNAPIGDRQP